MNNIISYAIANLHVVVLEIFSYHDVLYFPSLEISSRHTLITASTTTLKCIGDMRQNCVNPHVSLNSYPTHSPVLGKILYHDQYYQHPGTDPTTLQYLHSTIPLQIIIVFFQVHLFFNSGVFLISASCCALLYSTVHLHNLPPSQNPCSAPSKAIPLKSTF